MASSEQKLLGLVKGFAQRMTAVTTDIPISISATRLKGRVPSVPSLKDLSTAVTDSLSGLGSRSKQAANQWVDEASKQFFNRRSSLDSARASSIRRSMTAREASTPNIPFEQAMREDYMSQYDVVVRSTTDKDKSGELLPLPDDNKKDIIAEGKVESSSRGVFLKDIRPTTSIIEKSKVPVRAVVSKASVDSRTRALVGSLRTAQSTFSKLSRTEDLAKHLLQYSDAKIEAVRCGAIPVLLNFVLTVSDQPLKSQSFLTLSLLGYTLPPNGPGCRILSVDGGGARGIVALEVLRELEILTGKAPCDMFDYFIGVSTGALVVAMLAGFRLSAAEALDYYKRICSTLFVRDTLKGARRLLLSHGYYDSSAWENVLKKNMDEKLMVDVSRDSRGIRLAAVSAKIDDPDCSPYVFRSYGLPCGASSHYEGSSKYKIWEAMRASTAAPGFFSECRLDNNIHQDGGLLNNNPTAIGIHESRQLWPKEKLWSVVSLGTGRFRKSQELHNEDVAKAMGMTSWRSKLTSIISSATDTEGIHTTLQDLMPPSTYFRIQPILSEDLAMDVSSPEKMDILIKDSRNYVRDNPVLMRQIAEKLTTPRSAIRKANDWMKLQKDCTEFPVYSS